MRNLEIYFGNPFLNLEASFERKNRFSDEHIGRLTAKNTGGEYTVMITETLLRHEAFFGEYTNVKVKLALTEQQTQLVDALLEKFRKRVSRLNNLLIANEVDKTPVYQQFFPQGVMAFTENTNKGNALSNMTLIHTAVQANAGVSGGAVAVAEFADFMTQWNALRNLQIQLKGESEGGRTTRDIAEAAWADQLFRNLLTLAMQFRNQPDMVDDFFDQSVLRRKPNAEDEVLTGNVGANMQWGIEVEELDIDEDTLMILENPINAPNSIYKLQFHNTQDAAFDNSRLFVSVLSQTPPATHKANQAGFDAMTHYKYMVLYANDQQTAFKITVKQ